MFHGEATINVDTRVVMDAVQAYFDARFAPGYAPKVTSVEERRSSGGQHLGFKVVVRAAEPPAPEDPAPAPRSARAVAVE